MFVLESPLLRYTRRVFEEKLYQPIPRREKCSRIRRGIGRCATGLLGDLPSVETFMRVVADMTCLCKDVAVSRESCVCGKRRKPPRTGRIRGRSSGLVDTWHGLQGIIDMSSDKSFGGECGGIAGNPCVVKVVDSGHPGCINSIVQLLHGSWGRVV